MSRGFFSLLFILLLAGANTAYAKSVPHICYALLKMHTFAEVNELSERNDAALASLKTFVEKNEDPDLDFLNDVPDVYMPRVATFTSKAEDPMDIATVNARVRQLISDEAQLGADLAQAGSVALMQITGDENIANAMKILHLALDDFKGEGPIVKSQQLRNSFINQLWSLSFLSVLGTAGIHYSQVPLDKTHLTKLGIIIATYMYYSAHRVRDLESAQVSIEATSTLFNFVKNVEFIQSNKTVDWASFHADLRISRKFLRSIAKQQVTREVFNDEIWRQASDSNNREARHSSGNDAFDEVILRVDLIYRGADGGDSKPQFTLALRTEEASFEEDGWGGTRQRNREQQDDLSLVPAAADSF